jgi:hypothetical protein
MAWRGVTFVQQRHAIWWLFLAVTPQKIFFRCYVGFWAAIYGFLSIAYDKVGCYRKNSGRTASITAGNSQQCRLS